MKFNFYLYIIMCMELYDVTHHSAYQQHDGKTGYAYCNRYIVLFQSFLMLVKLDGIALEEELIHQEYDSGHGKANHHSHKQVAWVMYSEIGEGVTDYCSPYHKEYIELPASCQIHGKECCSP